MKPKGSDKERQSCKNQKAMQPEIAGRVSTDAFPAEAGPGPWSGLEEATELSQPVVLCCATQQGSP